jgi:predicted enzyme related to lactoylglutathione lyase
VVHFEIGARDAHKQYDFYRQLFGWKIDPNNPMNYGMVDTGGQGGINGGIMQTPDKDVSYVTFYVQVEDLQSYLDKAESLGGQTLCPPMPVPGVGAIALFKDPEGNIIGLFHSSPGPGPTA